MMHSGARHSGKETSGRTCLCRHDFDAAHDYADMISNAADRRAKAASIPLAALLTTLPLKAAASSSTTAFRLPYSDPIGDGMSPTSFQGLYQIWTGSSPHQVLILLGHPFAACSFEMCSCPLDVLDFPPGSVLIECSVVIGVGIRTALLAT